MYEYVTALTAVTVAFFLAVMIRYRAWDLGLFVTGAVVLGLGLAETVIYTPPGRWSRRCSRTGWRSTSPR
jgi:hypothetical protein